MTRKNYSRVSSVSWSLTWHPREGQSAGQRTLPLVLPHPAWDWAQAPQSDQAPGWGETRTRRLLVTWKVYIISCESNSRNCKPLSLSQSVSKSHFFSDLILASKKNSNSWSYLYSDVTVLAVPPRPEHSPPRSLPIPCWGRPGAPAWPLWWECLRGEDSGEDRADGGVKQLDTTRSRPTCLYCPTVVNPTLVVSLRTHSRENIQMLI